MVKQKVVYRCVLQWLIMQIVGRERERGVKRKVRDTERGRARNVMKQKAKEKSSHAN